ncbi:MAG: PEP/pyruvate-binding domain-containing protein [Promethearchaeota archaeon]
MSLSLYIKDLKEISNKDVEVVGNKAANLACLLRNGFKIPDGFVLTTSAYQEFLQFNDLEMKIHEFLSKIDHYNAESLERQAEEIRNAIVKGTIPPSIEAMVKQVLKNRKFSEVAVRSSAIAEDLPKASFAGQYDTYLNLKSVEQVLLHLKKCYASAWTARAISYRHAHQIPQEKVKLASIIQKMIPARCAGLLFTMNPMTFKTHEMIVESNFGLGESIVGGTCCPDQYIVERKKSKKGKDTFRILNKRIGNKNIAIIPKNTENEHGTEVIHLTEEENKTSSLTTSQILELARMGVKIEKIFNGIPQDIEWAIDERNNFIPLQARPITILKKPEHSKQEAIMWSRGYSDDYWNDNVSPLYFELLGDPLTKIVNMELNSIMGYKRMDKRLLKLFKAHVYFNLNVLKNKVENEIPKLMRNKDLLNYFPEGKGSFGKETIKDLPFHALRRIVAELRIMIHDPNGSITKTNQVYENWSKEEFVPFCRSLDQRFEKIKNKKDVNALLDLASALEEKMITHFRLIRYGIPVHNIGMNLLVQYLLTKFLSKEECNQYYPILISGLKNKLTETNEKIHELASFINVHPALKKKMRELPSDSIYSYLLSEKDSSFQAFLKKFNDFLELFGDRGFTREIYYPRWREPPMTNLFDILKSLISEEWDDLEKLKLKKEKRQKLIENLVESKIRSQRLGFLKWKIFSTILNFSRTYINFRENQRFNLDRWITKNRKIFLAIGNMFKEQGIIDTEEKIFFFKKQEIKKVAKRTLTEQQLKKLITNIERRYEQFKQNENILPSKFLLGSREFNDVLQHEFHDTVFQGIPASQGLITARVRILNEINQLSKVKKGEILVVSRTDPGWTPVFSMIGGLITETGGILSHGAVVSREYGIPAVTNIENACKIFQTGQLVLLNGQEGTVKILDE